jgi:hypothetical protein
MTVVDGLVRRDANGHPLEGGIIVEKVHTLVGSNATVIVPLFKITGSVKIKALYGVVEVVLGSNLTATHWRIDDQTAQVVISASAGTTISSLAVGSVLARKSLVSVALTADNASAAKVIDPVAATAPDVYMPFIVTQKTGGVLTELEFVYTTTNTPTSGRIRFVAEYIPLTDGSRLDPL